jgi:ethanolamine ammonia-lyase small subunit
MIGEAVRREPGYLELRQLDAARVCIMRPRHATFLLRIVRKWRI